MPNSMLSVRDDEGSVGRRGGYRGPDRRRAAAPDGAPTRSLLVALGLLAFITIAVALAAGGLGLLPTGRSHELEGAQWLTSSAAMLAALAAAVSAMRWRLVGEASALWIAAALLIYAVTGIAFPGIVQSLAPGSGVQSLATVLRPASVFVVIVLLSVAVAAPAVDAQLGPRRIAGVAAVAAAAGTFGAWVSADFRLILGPALDRPSLTESAALGQVGVAFLWAALGGAFLYRSVRGTQDTSPWIGVMLLCLAEARLAVALSVNADATWSLASQIFRLIGVGAGLAGASRDLQRAFVRQRAELLDSVLELASARARRRAERATEEERAHDLRAALAGIGGAAITLERHHAHLSEEERVALAGAVKAEIDRLQQIVNTERSEPQPFGLAGALSPALLLAAAGGVDVDLDVDADLTVLGRPAEVAEAVQNLVDNARLYAPGSPVTVRAEKQGLQAVLRVEDRGPGVPREHRERVFERGWRGVKDVDGSGLGLHVASKLVRGQGGDLWVEERPGGGASFVLTLPLAPQGAGVR